MLKHFRACSRGRLREMHLKPSTTPTVPITFTELWPLLVENVLFSFSNTDFKVYYEQEAVEYD